MKKILILSSIAIAVVLSSCSDQQKSRIYVKRYLGDDVKITDFKYIEKDTVYTFDEMYEVLKQVDDKVNEARRYKRLSEKHFSFGSVSLGERYGDKACGMMSEANILLDILGNMQPTKHIVSTVEVTYRNNENNYETDKFTLTKTHTVGGKIESLGVTLEEFNTLMRKIANKPLD